MLRSKAGQLWLRVSLAPFRAAIAAIIVVQAVIALGGWGLVDPINVLLPEWLATGFNLAYLLAGAALLFGILWPRGDVEAASLVLLCCTISARGVMFGALLGWGLQSISSLAFSACIAVGCAARVHLIVRSAR